MTAKQHKWSTAEVFHCAVMIIWTLLAIPSLLIWNTSITWLIVMMLYMNAMNHFLHWRQARIRRQLRSHDV